MARAQGSNVSASGPDLWAIGALVAAIAPCCPPVNLGGALLGAWRWRVNARRGWAGSARASIAACVAGLAVAALNMSAAWAIESTLLRRVEESARPAVDQAVASAAFAGELASRVGEPPWLVTAQSAEITPGAGLLPGFSSRWLVSGDAGMAIVECSGPVLPSSTGFLPHPRVERVRLQRVDGTILEWLPGEG